MGKGKGNGEGEFSDEELDRLYDEMIEAENKDPEEDD